MVYLNRKDVNLRKLFIIQNYGGAGGEGGEGGRGGRNYISDDASTISKLFPGRGCSGSDGPDGAAGRDGEVKLIFND